MFLRTKFMPSETRPARHAGQIVQSQRRGNKVRQRIVQHCGFADSPDALERLVALAEHQKLELEIMHDRGLFSPEEAHRQVTQAQATQATDAPLPKLKVDLARLAETQRVVTGIHDVYDAIYYDLGLGSLLPPSRYRVHGLVVHPPLAVRSARSRSSDVAAADQRRLVASTAKHVGRAAHPSSLCDPFQTQRRGRQTLSRSRSPTFAPAVRNPRPQTEASRQRELGSTDRIPNVVPTILNNPLMYKCFNFQTAEVRIAVDFNGLLLCSFT